MSATSVAPKLQLAQKEAKASNRALSFQQHLKLLKLRIAYKAAEAYMAPNSVNHQHSAKAPIAQKEAKASNCALSSQHLPKLLKVRIACKAAEAYMTPNFVNHQHSAKAPIARKEKLPPAP